MMFYLWGVKTEEKLTHPTHPSQMKNEDNNLGIFLINPSK